MTASALTRQRLKQLADEAVALAKWAVVRDFANQMHGEGKAAKVKIATYEAYDDENYSYPIGSITAYDRDGKELEFDHSLPFFSTFEWQNEARYDDHYDDLDVFKDLAAPKETKRSTWVFFEDLPDEDATYDLTRAPVIKGVSVA